MSRENVASFILPILLALIVFGPLGNCEKKEYACIEEGHGVLDLSQLAMIQNQNFIQYKIQDCVSHCLRYKTQYDFAMITYDDGFFRDKFNCICANEKAFEKNKRASDYRCREFCDDKKQYRCVLNLS